MSSSPSSAGDTEKKTAGTAAAVAPAPLSPLRSVTPRLKLKIVEETDSTQDEARRLLQSVFEGDRVEQPENAALVAPATAANEEEWQMCSSNTVAHAVIARRQRRGRGTQGRTWESGAEQQGDNAGNLFLTVSLPLDSIPVRITLLPLQVAVLVARLVDRYVAASAPEQWQKRRRRRTTVKWPNDVLVDDRKISGTLIESDVVEDRSGAGCALSSSSTTWMLIGIGINVNSAPDLDRASASPGKHGRLATCLRDAAAKDGKAALPTPEDLGTELASQLADWVFQLNRQDRPPSREELEAQVLEDWKALATFGTTYEMRGQTVEEETSHYQGERVTTLDIEPDGRLVVLDSSGRERRLVADYLF